MAPLSLRMSALVLVALFTAFWLWFGIASAFSEDLGTMNWILHALMPGGILLATLVVALQWEAIGGALLLVEGLIVAVGYPLTFGRRFPITTSVMMLLTLALPLLAAGIMLLVDARRAAWRA